jgi:hypothetical protein
MGLLGRFFGLGRTVGRIERAIQRLAKLSAQEPIWVTHYGAFDIQPRHLVYWICVKTDGERDRLRADRPLLANLRQLLVDFDYPPEGRDHVHIGFESQETVDRDSDGNWWHHWK